MTVIDELGGAAHFWPPARQLQSRPQPRNITRPTDQLTSQLRATADGSWRVIVVDAGYSEIGDGAIDHIRDYHGTDTANLVVLPILTLITGRDSFSVRDSLTLSISFSLDCPDGTGIRMAYTDHAQEFSSSREQCDLAIGANLFDGDLHRYRIPVEMRLMFSGARDYGGLTFPLYFGDRGAVSDGSAAAPPDRSPILVHEA